jgi:hypothetical protein
MKWSPLQEADSAWVWQKSPGYYGTYRSITVFMTAHRLLLSWAGRIHSISYEPTSHMPWSSKWPFPSVLPNTTLYISVLPHTCYATFHILCTGLGKWYLMLYGPCIILQCMCSPTDTQYSCITEFIHKSMHSTMFRTSRVHPQERPSCMCGFGKWWFAYC